LSIALAVPAALAIARYRFPGREAMTALFMSPLMVPHVVLGIAFLRFFSEVGLSGRFVGLVIAHVIVIMPFALRLVLAASFGIDQRIEHAAISLGAGPATVFRRITLSLILPGIVSGWMLAFISSFDEVTMTVFIASPRTTTLPVRLLIQIQDNLDPLVASVSATLIALTSVFLIVLDRLYGLDRLFLGQPKH
jgi:putative spermidine/putrescine transport system permease protein